MNARGFNQNEKSEAAQVSALVLKPANQLRLRQNVILHGALKLASAGARPKVRPSIQGI